MTIEDKWRVLIALWTIVIFSGVNFLMLIIKVDKLEKILSKKGDTKDAKTPQESPEAV